MDVFFVSSLFSAAQIAITEIMTNTTIAPITSGRVKNQSKKKVIPGQAIAKPMRAIMNKTIISFSYKIKKCVARSHAPKNAGSVVATQLKATSHENAKKESEFLPKDKNAHSWSVTLLSCVANSVYHTYAEKTSHRKNHPILSISER